MAFEEFTLRYALTRKQRLVPHLRVWMSHSPAGISAALLFLIALFAALFVLPPGAWLLCCVVFLPVLWFVKEFYFGLASVLFIPKQSVSLCVKEDSIGILAGNRSLWIDLERTLSFEQYTAGTWTLYHHSGVVITIPSSALTEDQLDHLQRKAKRAQEATQAVASPRLPGPEGLFRDAPIQCYTSRLKLLGLMAGSILVVGFFYFLTTIPKPLVQVLGWIVVVVVGVAFVALARGLFRKGPRLIFSDEGIEDRRKKVGVIRWEDINSLYIGVLGSEKFLGIELEDTEKYLGRQKKWVQRTNKALGHPDVMISFTELRPGILEVWKQLEERGVLETVGTS